MPEKTAISWTDSTWNPVHGCSKVSAGCLHCYAETISLRYGHTSKPWATRHAAENVTEQPHKLSEPLRWKEPRRVFVNSMSDLFHDNIGLDYIRRVFAVMHKADHHRFQILTKRAERLAEVAPLLHWPHNVWMGVSVEDARATHRIDLLRTVPAHVRFISFEPLIGPIENPDLSGIQWAIVGGESGDARREMDHAWARMIRDACLRQQVAFFFKQSSDRYTERGVALLHEDGSYWIWQQFPDHVKQPVPVPVQIDGRDLAQWLPPQGRDPFHSTPAQAARTQRDLFQSR